MSWLFYPYFYFHIGIQKLNVYLNKLAEPYVIWRRWYVYCHAHVTFHNFPCKVYVITYYLSDSCWQDRPSTKVHAAPGGGSSLGYLFGGGSNWHLHSWSHMKALVVDFCGTYGLMSNVFSSALYKTAELNFLGLRCNIKWCGGLLLSLVKMWWW